MKNIMAVVSMVLLTSPAFAADQAVMPAKAAAPAAVAAPAVAVAKVMNTAAMEKVLTGMVKAISTADAAKGTKSEIIITATDGKDTTLLLKSTTTVYDMDAHAVAVDKIASGHTVSAVYMTTPEGVNEAKSVKIVH